MITPITVPVTPIVAISANRKRNAVRFQNSGATTLYFVRQIGTTTNVPSATNYEYSLAAPTVTDPNENSFTTNSTAQFNVVSSAVGGILAIAETVTI